MRVLTKEAGLDGVVAAGTDIEMIRELCGKDFVIVTPGVRIQEKKDDQKRVITPQDAIRKGATYIVLGRAIMDAENPKALLDKTCQDLKNALPH